MIATPSAFDFMPFSLNSAPIGDLVDIDTKLMRVTASDSSGLKAILLSIIGDYETVVTDYTYNNGSYTSHSIQIERDWAWILAAIIFGLVIWCNQLQRFRNRQ